MQAESHLDRHPHWETINKIQKKKIMRDGEETWRSKERKDIPGGVECFDGLLRFLHRDWKQPIVTHRTCLTRNL
jgi:hypothetical protein